MDPKIQNLVEEYFRRPLTPEEGQRLSEWLSASPEETQRFAQRMEILNARAEGRTSEVALKDLTPSRNPPWARTAFWFLLILVGAFLYWRLTAPVVLHPSRADKAGKPDVQSQPAQGSVKVFQSRKSLPLPQISTPIPFQGGQKAEHSPSQP